MTDRTPEQQILDRALAKSGLSPRRFAKEMVVRDERTVRRWLRGEQTIPQTVQRWLHVYLDDN